MKNFKVVDKKTDKEYWISRSVAVAVILFYQAIDGQFFVLLEKRGKGCPDFVGDYCLPCGYVDWDESLEEAACREVFEETGLKLTKEDRLNLFSIQSNPKDNVKQNITVRFSVKVAPERIINALASGEMNTNTRSRGGEPDEVECFKLIPLADVNKYNMAWNHDQVILNWYGQYFTSKQIITSC